MSDAIHLVECPRDAMQGIHAFIPTERKTAYIQSLIGVGFQTIDFGSFVSEKAIPQMRDTEAVLKGLDLKKNSAELLAIVANRRGAEAASSFAEITCLGYPFSVSPTFQKRNANSTIEESLARVSEIQELCMIHDKKLVVYISMGFGNPYGDPWDPEHVASWCQRLYKEFAVGTLSLSDTVGIATPDSIRDLFETLIPALPEVQFGAHLHTTPDTWREKVEAAYEAGCRRFDGALMGYGGCPMAADALTGNMPTEKLIEFLDEKKEVLSLDRAALHTSLVAARDLFGSFS